MPNPQVKITGEDQTAAAWRSAVGRADSAGRKISGIFKAAFAGISVGVLAGAIGRSIEFGDALGKAAAKSGIATKAFSELAHAAQMSDVEMSSLSGALAKMQKALSEASTGSKPVQLALQAIGVDLRSLQRLSPDRQFEALADAINRLKDPADRTRAAMEIFGKSGADLLPLFEQGASGIRKAREEAIALGKSMDGEAVKRLEAADDAFKRLKASGSALADTLAVKLGPSIASLADTMRQLIGGATPMEELRAELALAERGAAMVAARAPAMAEQAARRVAEIRGRIAQEQRRAHLAGGGGFRGRGASDAAADEAPPGFAAADAAAKAAEEAQKAQAKFNEWFEREQRTMAKDLGKLYEGTSEDRIQGELELREALGVTWHQQLEQERELARLRKEMAQEQFAGIELFRDGMKSAVDDMIRTGKFSVRSFVQFMIAEFSRKELFKSIDAIADAWRKALGSKQGSGGGGLLGSIFGAIGGLFGGGVSGAGPGGPSGQILAGPLAAGTNFVPRNNFPALLHKGEAVVPAKYNPSAGGMGRGMVINIHNDNRGATHDLIRALPEHDRRLAEQIEARVVDGIRRKVYDLG